MKPVLLVRNDAWESFGVAPGALARTGVDLLTVNLTEGADLPPLDEVSGVIAFGGTANVDMTDRYPYLATARGYTREAVDRGVPYLGICLGSQLLARALGRPVVRSAVKEVGFVPLRPTADAKEDRLLSLYVGGDMVFEWHEDTYDLPEGGVLLGIGDDVPTQAYRVGELAWGIQFHQEVDAGELAWWIDIADAETDLQGVWGTSADALRAQAADHIAEHEERGRELFRRFADVVREATD